MATLKYSVLFSPSAEKDLSEISDKQEIKKAINYVNRLSEVGTAGATPLRLGRQDVLLWRKKLGRLRVMFTLDKEKRQIVVRAVDLRNQDTYDDIYERLDWQP